MGEKRDMDDIIARIDAHLDECASARCQELEPDSEPILRECRDEIIAARACAEMMLQGTGQRLAESMAERVINGQTVGRWIPVSERLPEDESMVLVWSQSNGLHLAYLDSYRQWRDADMNFGKKITRWMPIPEPPEVE